MDMNSTEIIYTVAAAADGTLFAAKTSGVFRSTDGGQSWQCVFDSAGLPTPLPVVSLALSPAFTVDRTAFAGVPGGVLRSVDGGQTWTVGLLPSPAPFVSSLAVSPNYASDGVVFAGTMEDGVFCSFDRGARWFAWNFGLLDQNVFGLAVSPDFAADQTVYVATESGVFASQTQGRSWRVTGMDMDQAPVFCLAAGPRGALLAGTESNGLLASADGGDTWQAARLPDEAEGGAINAVAFTEHAAVALVEDRLYVSRDAGHSWAAWGAPLPEGIVVFCGLGGFAPGSALALGLVDASLRVV